jgi:hypothetical protein
MRPVNTGSDELAQLWIEMSDEKLCRERRIALKLVSQEYSKV